MAKSIKSKGASRLINDGLDRAIYQLEKHGQGAIDAGIIDGIIDDTEQELADYLNRNLTQLEYHTLSGYIYDNL